MPLTSLHHAGDDTLAHRLERGELLPFAPCPFPLPAGDDLAFLFAQQLRGPLSKNISYDPRRGRVSGFAIHSHEHTNRLADLMARFADNALRWLASLLPGYAPLWEIDRITFRPDEEATRRLRPTARNDLLHFDAFPSRPSQGRRILRLFVNMHPTDPRVWTTSETFDKLVARYGRLAGLPGAVRGDWLDRARENVLRLLTPGDSVRSAYDRFMLRLHHFLKLYEPFQERAPKKLWRFPPGTAWLLFTDMLSHAELRGRYALELSLFVPTEALALPQLAPAALLAAKCATTNHAA
jgi:hypothetical protein